MRFNKAKCKIPAPGLGQRRYHYSLGNEGMESSPAQKDLRVLLDEKLDMTWQ